MKNPDLNGEEVEVDTSDSGTPANRPQLTIAFSIPPNVTILSPVESSIFNASDVVNITTNVTSRNETVDTVLANVTLPNATIRQVELLNLATDIFNFTFTETSLDGVYNVTIIANNTNGTINATETTNFTVEVAVQLNFSNISVVKTDSIDPINASSELNYTINITSTGNATAFNVTLNDTYPDQVIFNRSQPTATTGNNSFILGNLTPGTSVLVNITVFVMLIV